MTRGIIQFVAPLIAALHHLFQLNENVCYLSAKNYKGELVEESQEKIRDSKFFNVTQLLYLFKYFKDVLITLCIVTL